ncbi:Synaptic vesicle transporter SVOP [Exophiala xenobiotica]|nr:Synaptic vesicle transporter SVOP [Exophiala xenobiotica]KAK5335351.1 Synaptic vesicle transporter SVOP [Exophiala xenobiotica]
MSAPLCGSQGIKDLDRLNSRSYSISPQRPQNEGLFTSEPLEVPVFASAPSTNAKEVATEEPHVCGYELRDITNADGEVKLYKMVVFGPADPENPRNFSKTRKWVITMTLSWVCFAVAFSSAVITPGILGVAEHFHTSEEVALLTITLFVVGFGIGPLVFGPLSELYGRWIVYVATFGVAIIFMVPCAVAKNIQTLLVCRAIDGIAISVPVANLGGSLADLWHADERGVPMSIFSGAPFLGPIMGPLIGGFTYENLGWRWLYYLQIILAGFLYICMVLFVPETYAPVILARRAKRLRESSGDNTYIAEHDLTRRSFKNIVQVYLARPLRLLLTEPIVTLFSLYAAVLYGLLYMYFVAYPIVFQEGKGMSPGMTGLMFLPLMGGIVVGLVGSPFVNRHYLSLRAKYEGLPPPELRLIPMIYGCWLIPMGVFIFAWSSYPRLSWAGPCFAGLPIGVGFVLVYNSFNNYIVDSYQHTAASALAAKTLIRSLWGACTVLFTSQILGYQWASTLLGFIALACCLIPVGFYRYGAAIRKHSKYAYSGKE